MPFVTAGERWWYVKSKRLTWFDDARQDERTTTPVCLHWPGLRKGIRLGWMHTEHTRRMQDRGRPVDGLSCREFDASPAVSVPAAFDVFH